MHLVMYGHFWSHDKDGGHTIRSAIMVLCFVEAESCTLRE